MSSGKNVQWGLYALRVDDKKEFFPLDYER